MPVSGVLDTIGGDAGKGGGRLSAAGGVGIRLACRYRLACRNHIDRLAGEEVGPGVT
jgi:hypothetical protein